MYSVDDIQSYNDLSTWQADIERFCPPQTRLLIIGNKCDLPNRVVPVEQGLLVSCQLLYINSTFHFRNPVNTYT